MSDPARRRNIADCLGRAVQALAVAEAALAIGGTADALSRTYYAALYYVQALLFARGLDPRTHRGAHHLFNQEFVRPGLFSAKTSRLLGSLQKQREEADYEPGTVFDVEDAREQVAAVRQFGDRVVDFLRGERLVDS